MTVPAEQQDNTDLVSIAADIVSAYVSNNPVPVAELPKLIGDIHVALRGIGTPAAEPAVKLEPAVSIRKSVTSDYIICLEDGKKFKSLKRHLNTHYKLTPEEYRQKWNLPADYPMVAPNYAAARSALAKAAGLGQKRKVAVAGSAVTLKPKRTARAAAAAIHSAAAKSLVKKTRKVPAKI
ncbi:MucR family transcriptional regulator [Mesorhizobium cantuariense]|uniref:MucR family transcriptional regulator n=1 Tax=Mesorhizobium cantuariense TaxID=1300275 RepID=A0ABV7MQ51_9HYPH